MMNKIFALITRPKHQADKLCKKIENLGGETVLFPTLEIISYRNSSNLKQAIEEIPAYSWAIFLSANATEAIAELWHQHEISVPTIAIGTGTANSLASHDIAVDLVPEEFSSSGILKLPELQEIKNEKIAIFCGENPKPDLKRGLVGRGALVKEIYCYRRERPRLSPENKIPERVRRDINVIVSTSRESLINLHAIFAPNDVEWLLDKPLIVISSKMKQCAKDLGWRASIYVSKNPSDEAILEALGGVQ